MEARTLLLSVAFVLIFAAHAHGFDVRPPYSEKLLASRWQASSLRRSISDSLSKRGVASKFSAELLLGTAIAESDLGRMLRQQPEGPARGIFQIETSTMERIIKLAKNSKDPSSLQSYIKARAAAHDILYMAKHDFDFQVACAFVLYSMRGVKMNQDAYTVHSLASTWKRVWNTHLGKGTVEYFIKKYNKANGFAEGNTK